MKLLFIGSTRRGYLTLNALLEAGTPVVGIISLAQDEHEIDRFEGPIRDLGKKHGIPVREVRALRDPSLIEWVKEDTQAQAAFAIGVRVLLPKSLIDVFSRGCWAVHDSLLPQYRGFAPLNWAIINGEKETGVTLFQIAEGVDTGDILLQKRLPIGPDENAPQAYERVCVCTVEIVLEGYRLLRDCSARPVPQDHCRATYTCSRNPSDGLVDWSLPSKSIHNLIRALTFPYPGAFTFHENKKLFLHSSELITDSQNYVGRISGRVVRIERSGVDVLTGDGIIRLLMVSGDGQTPVNASETIRSVRTRLGIDWSAIIDFSLKLPRV